MKIHSRTKCVNHEPFHFTKNVEPIGPFETLDFLKEYSEKVDFIKKK